MRKQYQQIETNYYVVIKYKNSFQIYIMYMHSNFELGSGYATVC